jgi:hypothetical protein
MWRYFSHKYPCGDSESERRMCCLKRSKNKKKKIDVTSFHIGIYGQNMNIYNQKHKFFITTKHFSGQLKGFWSIVDSFFFYFFQMNNRKKKKGGKTFFKSKHRFTNSGYSIIIEFVGSLNFIF